MVRTTNKSSTLLGVATPCLVSAQPPEARNDLETAMGGFSTGAVPQVVPSVGASDSHTTRHVRATSVVGSHAVTPQSEAKVSSVSKLRPPSRDRKSNVPG
jgi:hypothetical protein